jgi:hypothetical protein
MIEIRDLLGECNIGKFFLICNVWLLVEVFHYVVETGDMKFKHFKMPWAQLIQDILW